jgi:hypothetical protein
VVILWVNKTQLKNTAISIHWAIVIRGDALTKECHTKMFIEKNMPSNGQGNNLNSRQK